MNTFAERLKQLQGAATIQEFADQIGCPYSNLFFYLKGRIPRGDFLQKIIKKLGVSSEWLLIGEGPIYKKDIGLSLDEIPRQYCTFVENLKKIPRDMRTEDYLSIPLVEGRIAAGEPIISPDQIEGWAIIHVNQVGRKSNLVAIRVDEYTGMSMEPLLRAGSMVAIDRNDREPREKMVYAVKKDDGATIKFVHRERDILIMIPGNPDRKTHPIQTLDLKGLDYDPIIGRVIWNWQTL